MKVLDNEGYHIHVVLSQITLNSGSPSDLPLHSLKIHMKKHFSSLFTVCPDAFGSPELKLHMVVHIHKRKCACKLIMNTCMKCPDTCFCLLFLYQLLKHMFYSDIRQMILNHRAGLQINKKCSYPLF